MVLFNNIMSNRSKCNKKMLSLQIMLSWWITHVLKKKVYIEFHLNCFYWQLGLMLNKEEQKNISLLVEKFTRQVSKNIALLSWRGNQDLLTWNIKSTQTKETQHIIFINLFLFSVWNLINFLQVTHRLSAHIYKIHLDEYIAITCLLILETLAQPSFLIA